MDSNADKKLEELINDLNTVPLPQREKLLKLAKKTNKCHEELKDSVTKLQSSLDGLRLSVKYLIFDLEATRRENVKLKKSLDGGNNK